MAPIERVSKFAPDRSSGLLPDAEAREHPIENVVRRHHADQVVKRADRGAQVRRGRRHVHAAAPRRVERFDFGEGALQRVAVACPRHHRLDIAQRYRADFVITHLFGRSPSVSIKELKRIGYPLKKVVGMVWGASEADIEAAGGFAATKGYNAMQFAGVGTDYPVLNEIREMYKKQGKEAPKEMVNTVLYNRGVLIAAVHVEAVRNALKAKAGGAITGADVKAGFEKIKGFTLGGLVPPLEITVNDHEGGGWVQIFTVKGGKFVKATEWDKAYGDVLAKHIKAAK